MQGCYRNRAISSGSVLRLDEQLVEIAAKPSNCLIILQDTETSKNDPLDSTRDEMFHHGKGKNCVNGN